MFLVAQCINHSYITAMNREQALKHDHDVKAYSEKNKLRPLFSDLTKRLLLSRPDDPISFLIKYLENRNPKIVVCVQGYEEERRSRLATALTNKFNFSLVNVSVLFGSEDYHFLDSKVVSQRVIAEIKKVDNIYRGIVVSGFPNNATQADSLQKEGILADRYFLLYNDEPAIRSAYAKKYGEEQTELLMDRNALQLKQLKEILGDKYDQLPLTTDKAAEKINSTIGIRLRKVMPLDAPRIFVLHPPFLVPKALNTLAERYSFHRISVESVFRRLNKKEDFKNRVEAHIRQNKALSKETELALIETECKSGTAKTKGFIVSGWPSRKESLPFLKQHYLSPHIILVFNCVKEKGVEELQKLSAQDEVFCISEKPSSEKYRALLKEYESIVQSVKGLPNCQLLTLHENDSQVLKTFQNFIENPKIYY